MTPVSNRQLKLPRCHPEERSDEGSAVTQPLASWQQQVPRSARDDIGRWRSDRIATACRRRAAAVRHARKRPAVAGTDPVTRSGRLLHPITRCATGA